jgi:hypothetical protein
LGTNQKDQIFYQPYFDCFLAAARTKLSETEFTSAWEAGSKLTREQAIALAENMLDEL